jgi:hypothetical protein
LPASFVPDPAVCHRLLLEPSRHPSRSGWAVSIASWACCRSPGPRAGAPPTRSPANRTQRAPDPFLFICPFLTYPYVLSRPYRPRLPASVSVPINIVIKVEDGREYENNRRSPAHNRITRARLHAYLRRSRRIPGEAHASTRGHRRWPRAISSSQSAPAHRSTPGDDDVLPRGCISAVEI